MSELVTASRNPTNTGYVTDNMLRNTIKFFSYSNNVFINLADTCSTMPNFNETNDPNGTKQVTLTEGIMNITNDIQALELTENFNLNDFISAAKQNFSQLCTERNFMDLIPIFNKIVDSYSTAQLDNESSLSLAENQSLRVGGIGEILQRLDSTPVQNTQLNQILSDSKNLLDHFELNGNIKTDFSIDLLEVNFFVTQSLLKKLNSIDQNSLNSSDKATYNDLKSFFGALNTFFLNQMAPLILSNEPANRSEVSNLFNEITETLPQKIADKVLALAQNLEKPNFELVKQIWENAKAMHTEKATVPFLCTLMNKVKQTVVAKTSYSTKDSSRKDTKGYVIDANATVCKTATEFLSQQQQQQHQTLMSQIQMLPEKTSDEKQIKSTLQITAESIKSLPLSE